MLRHYLIWTWRTLAGDRWTTLLNLLALSLGMVSFALTVAAGLFLRSTDVELPNADRIYAVSEQITNSDGTPMFARLPMTNSPVAKYLEAENPEVEAISLLMGGEFIQTAVNGKSRQLAPLYFDESFARVFKLPLRYGDPDRAFTQPRAVILTADTADRLFGAANPVGQSMRLSDMDVTITGVLPRLPSPSMFNSTPGNHIDMLASREVRDRFQPLQSEPETWDNYAGYTMIRLHEGQTPDVVRARLADFGARHIQRLQRIYTFDLVPLMDTRRMLLDAFLGADKTGLSVPDLLLALGGLVLFVASLNYANLAAAKAVGRLPESGMKKMLGAGRGELMAQYLTESLVLTVVALALVLAALAGLAGPLKQGAGIDLSRLLFHRSSFWVELAAGVTAATLAGGLYPAWMLSGPRAMAAALGGKAKPTRSRFASTLVGLQFLTAGVLLIMVVIVVRQNHELGRMAESLGGRDLLAIDTTLDGQAVSPRDVLNAVREIPGVVAVGASNTLPWSIGPGAHRYYKDTEMKGPAIQGSDFQVSEDYFATMGTRLLAGRGFSTDRGGDLRPKDVVPEVSFNVIVDRAVAQGLGWTPEQAVGQTIWHHTLTGGSAPIQIIGVVETQPQTMLSLGATGIVYAFAPDQAILPLIRLARDAGPDTVAEIDRALVRLAPQIDWHRHFADELFQDGAAVLSILVAALGVLALFAVAIALLGLAGMAVHTTNSRTEEIGIRKILGADHFVIMRLLIWDMTRPVLIASLAACPLAYIAGRFYLALFTGHTTIGLWPFVISLAVTMGVSWLAVGWRIASASVKSPAEVLRYE